MPALRHHVGITAFVGLAWGAAACSQSVATRCQDDADCPRGYRCSIDYSYCYAADAATPDGGRDAGPEAGPDASREAGWDASQDASLPSSPRQVFRSVGPSRTPPLASNGDSALTLEASIAHFSAALPDAVGVGDVLQFDSDGDAQLDRLAFVSRRLSANDLVVTDRLGAPLAATVTAHHTWSLCRAYTALQEGLTGEENRCVHAPLRDFDNWDEGFDRDLVAADVVWNFACYGDDVDVQRVTFEGWRTDPTRYVRAFTPTLPNEVGRSQRHAGVWSDQAYRLRVDLGSGCCSAAFAIKDLYARVEGLQLEVLTSGGYQNGVLVSPAELADSEIHVSHSIIKGSGLHAAHAVYGMNVGGGAVAKIYDNIVYGFMNAQGELTGISLGEHEGNEVYAYHNTVAFCGAGIQVRDLTEENILKNNLATFNGKDYYPIGGGAFDRHEGNVSTDGTSPDLDLRLAPVSFVDASGGNFHLAAGDTGARDRGVDLSGDFNLPVIDDIDGEVRPQGAGWNAGADE